MASSSSNEVLSNAHENTDTYSVYNCVFCNVLLNGKAKLLDCLHVTCYECMEKKSKETDGLLCKCNVVTYGIPVNYPIVSPDVSITKTCHNCDSDVKKDCVTCKRYYRNPCSMSHSNSSVGLDHHPNVVISNPTKTDFAVCQECSEKNAEVYCLRCDVMSCSFCHLISHRNHCYKLIGEYCNEVKKSLTDELHKLNKNDERIEKAIDDISKVTQKLEIQKNALLSEIDLVTQKLHNKINKCLLGLKEEAETAIQLV